MKNDYEDILHLPHHTSKIHPQMKRNDRAAQFAPFAALTGHDEAIKETSRIVEQKLDLDEYQKTMINQTLNYIKEHIKENLKISLTYFLQDSIKTGGMYLNITDEVKKIDDFEHIIILQNHHQILFEDIYSIDIFK